MELPKVKEILELNAKEAGKKMPPDCLTAVKIGAQAIKRILYMRSYNIAQAMYPLPGETRNESTTPKP